MYILNHVHVRHANGIEITLTDIKTMFSSLDSDFFKMSQCNSKISTHLLDHCYSRLVSPSFISFKKKQQTKKSSGEEEEDTFFSILT